MLYQWIRMIYSDNGTLSDKSLDNQDESTTVSMVMHATEDWMYVGQHYPFNNFFLQVDTVNSNASAIEVEYWSGQGNQWKDAVDILDGTASAGVPLAKSGVVQFSPDNSWTWQDVSDTENEDPPIGLTGTNIYNIYWARFRYTTQLSAGSAIKRLAYAFTLSQQIENLDVRINRYLTTFASGKTDWTDEIITASVQVVMELRRRGLIVAPGQILRFDDVSMAADWKTLALIYMNLGPAFAEPLARADLEFSKALDLTRFSFDQNNDAFMGRNEITNKIGKLVR